MARLRSVSGNHHQAPSLMTNMDVETHFQMQQQNDAYKKAQKIKSHRNVTITSVNNGFSISLICVTALNTAHYNF